MDITVYETLRDSTRIHVLRPRGLIANNRGSIIESSPQSSDCGNPTVDTVDTVDAVEVGSRTQAPLARTHP